MAQNKARSDLKQQIDRSYTTPHCGRQTFLCWLGLKFRNFCVSMTRRSGKLRPHQQKNDDFKGPVRRCCSVMSHSVCSRRDTGIRHPEQTASIPHSRLHGSCQVEKKTACGTLEGGDRKQMMLPKRHTTGGRRSFDYFIRSISFSQLLFRASEIKRGRDGTPPLILKWLFSYWV